MTDRVDEWMLSFLTEFEGKELVSVAKGGLDLGGLEDEAEKKEQENEVVQGTGRAHEDGAGPRPRTCA